MANTLYCSFCGKSQYEVMKLIAGPTVFICDECVDLCTVIVAEARKKGYLSGEEWQRRWIKYVIGLDSR